MARAHLMPRRPSLVNVPRGAITANRAPRHANARLGIVLTGASHRAIDGFLLRPSRCKERSRAQLVAANVVRAFASVAAIGMRDVGKAFEHFDPAPRDTRAKDETSSH